MLRSQFPDSVAITNPQFVRALIVSRSNSLDLDDMSSLKVLILRIYQKPQAEFVKAQAAIVPCGVSGGPEYDV